MRRWLALTVAVVIVAACSTRLDGTEPLASADPSATPASTAKPLPTAPPAKEPPPSHFSDERDGVALTVDLDRTVIDPGTDLHVRAVFQNRRPVKVDYAVSCGTAPRMWVETASPIAPLGQAWDGFAGVFKDYVLAEGLGPGGVPAGQATTTGVPPVPCREGDVWEAFLGPGQSLVAEFAWRPTIVTGVPALPGPVDFSVSVAFERQNEPPEHPGIGPPVPSVPAARAHTALWFPTYKELTVRGTIEIGAGAPPIISGGQALDRVLADPEFRAWLATAPRATWVNANLFLEAGYTSTLGFTLGPHWSVELFLEPRRFAIVSVDPWSGAVLHRNVCEVPCDR